MRTIYSKADEDAFRLRMHDHLSALPTNPETAALHVEQGTLDYGVFFTHRMEGGQHHVLYDPKQISGIDVRHFLGIYVATTEGELLDRVREAFYAADSEAYRSIIRIVLDEIDRTQDGPGVVGHVLALMTAEHAGATA
ncbi:hypothetical protein [Streptomyces sp. NPDC059759]|uniref:hypothetical protein n=1 Tax=Streptomyces sp. NPDC059759 TaxID=3346936 RepID=UPI003662BAC7